MPLAPTPRPTACLHATLIRPVSASAQFDIVVANILSNPLKLLAPALLARVAPAGALVLSGVLERQADEVIATYRDGDPGSRSRFRQSATDGSVSRGGAVPDAAVHSR